jgi:GH25 family lysozyme M1 (1,4-beta-N-acetylmuramidase)
MAAVSRAVTSRLVLDRSDNNALPSAAACGELGAAIEKLSEGVSYLNPQAAEAIATYRAHDVPAGGYHFFHPEESLADQVDLFCGQLRRFKIGRAFLDVELNLAGSPEAVMTPAEWIELGQLVARFCGGVERWAAVSVYSAPDFLEQMPMPSGVDLWLAEYPATAPTESTRPPRPCALWQWTDTGRLAEMAGDVDLSWCYAASIPRYFRAS